MMLTKWTPFRDVDSEKISASFKDGVLKLEIPKPEDAKPKQITVH